MRARALPELLELFTTMAAIPSPPGDERAVADLVTEYLRGLGLDVHEDDAGAKVDASAGNLLARIEPSNGAGVPLFFCAHLDTVPPDGPIEPVVDDGVVRNAAGTILGADNKASVAVMLDAVRRCVEDGRRHGGIELLFTPKEEVGLLGAAARAIADLRLGRIDDETTSNVGVIHGGTAANIVPERCSFLAEARSHDPAKLADLVREMSEAIAFAASLEECEAETEVRKSYRGYRFRRDDLPVALARRALERCGYEPSLGLSGGAADANVFNDRGLQCVNLANGMVQIHTADEHIAVADLEAMVDVTLALVEEARVAA